MRIRKFKELRKLRVDLMRQSDQNHIQSNIQEIDKKLDHLLEMEEVHWKVRSRNNWLVNGDRNTGYFHACANERRKRNVIKGLMDSNGGWHIKEVKVVGIVHDYFKGLFTSLMPIEEQIRAITDCIHIKISEEVKERLTQPFDTNDVLEALKSFIL